MSDAEFWGLEPAELKALVEQYNREEEEKGKLLQIQEENADRRAALICAVVANCHRDSKRKPFKVEDFLPRKGKETKAKQTPEQMMQMVKLWNAAYQGKSK